ncbi:MAG: GYD domain-containing protein [Candidatus Bathyarchaeota archaeon]|nr:MAG: GYD domain-containing protein [Candidatus Bathyarchaeota archaeon]
MIFITLTKWKTAPKKEMVDQFTKTVEKLEKQGIKMRVYWTLGRYNGVTITEAANEKDLMKILLPFAGLIDTETMVAVPREEAIKLL